MSDSPQRNDSSLNERQFTAQKETQLKARFPRKSEAQIKKMVQDLFEEEKKKLLQTENLSTNQKKNNISNEEQQSSQKNPQKRLFVSEEKPIYVPVSNEKIPLKPMTEGKISATKTPEKKTKKIKKDNNVSPKRETEYMKFFKYYKEKLGREHPKWVFAQIQKIIILLWRKKVLSERQLISKRRVFIRSKRNHKTGRRFFGFIKREEGMENDSIKDIWTRLPRQSRRYLDNIAKNKGVNGFINIFLKMMQEKSNKIPFGPKNGLSKSKSKSTESQQQTQPNTLSFMNHL